MIVDVMVAVAWSCAVRRCRCHLVLSDDGVTSYSSGHDSCRCHVRRLDHGEAQCDANDLVMTRYLTPAAFVNVKTLVAACLARHTSPGVGTGAGFYPIWGGVLFDTCISMY